MKDKHKRAAIENMKHLDDQADDEDTELVLLAGSVVLHAVFYLGDGLHRIADALEHGTAGAYPLDPRRAGGPRS